MGTSKGERASNKPPLGLLLTGGVSRRLSSWGGDPHCPFLEAWLILDVLFCVCSQVKQSQSDLLLPHPPDGPAPSQRCVLRHRGAARGLLRHAPSCHQTVPQGSEGEVSLKRVAGHH